MKNPDFFDRESILRPVARVVTHVRAVTQMTLLTIFIGSTTGVVRAETPSWHEIRESADREQFRTLVTAIERVPAAELAGPATEVLTLAGELGREADVLPLTVRILTVDSTTDPSPIPETLVRLAREVQVLGWASDGDWKQVQPAFAEVLKGSSLRNPTAAVQLAIALASRAQIEGEQEFASEVLRSTADHFFLNAPTKRMLLDRANRLELLGKPAPELSVIPPGEDGFTWPVTGENPPKILIVDFWATNCPPCLRSLPKLRQWNSRYHRKGLMILGVTLDDRFETVREFEAERGRLDWTLALSTSDGGETRHRYRVTTIPALFVLDQQGTVIAVDPTLPDLNTLLHRQLAD